MDIVVGSNHPDSGLYAWASNGTLFAGWPLDVGSGVNSSPVLGDLDPSFPGLEIAFWTISNRLYVIHWDGTLVTGDWPKELLFGSDATSPTLGDIDGDSALEIVVGTIDGIYAFESNGTEVTGWPVYREKPSFSSPTLGDIDNDGDIEIIVGSSSSDNRIYAYHHNGTKVKGFPIKTGYHVHPSAALQDLDEDGNIEIATGSSDWSLYVWDLPGYYNSNNIEWGKFRHDIWNTGNYNTQISELPPPPAVYTDGNQSGVRENMLKIFALRQNTPNPFGKETVIQYQLPKTSHAELKIYNIVGQHIKTIVDKSQEPGIYQLGWNGKDDKGRKVSSGIYFYRLQAGNFTATKKLLFLK
jgi:hypothetical protein